MFGEITTMTFMAFALGMDAFSLSIGMGLIDLRYKHIAKIGMTVGSFHVLMPLIGIALGRILSEHIGVFAFILGGFVLVFIGLQMILTTFKKEETRFFHPSGLGLILFSISVSLDSFSAGLSLGMLGARTWLAIASFGWMSAILTWLGLILGKKIGHLFGPFSEWLGGSILILFGIKIIFAL